MAVKKKKSLTISIYLYKKTLNNSIFYLMYLEIKFENSNENNLQTGFINIFWWRLPSFPENISWRYDEIGGVNLEAKIWSR